MSRLAMFALALIVILQLTTSSAQAQTFSRGVPASAMSPEPDGRQHGVPASVVSPVPLPPGVHPQFQFGNHFFTHGPRRRFVTHRDRGNIFVPVPVFYPIYGYGDPAYPVADPYIPASQDSATDSSANAASTDDAAPSSSDHELQAAYLQGARDALAHERDSARYGDHYMDSRERVRSRKEESPAPPAAVAEPAPQPPRESNSPKTVFIFKDGHQIETRNFAIVGQTLYDFSDSGLKKVQLSEMDKDATVKANDDRGIQVKLQ
ncbi:MAG TPA: hypothetical protein VFR08_06520 [Candidatus Angelobacter sp.]|nr:hypothetical protein [Candidatus Angelobacter sp.]